MPRSDSPDFAAPITVCLPTTDRATSHRFYSELGLTAFGELAEDGVPEPLQFHVNDGLRIMLIPTGGFGWLLGERDVAATGSSECVITVDPGSPAGVDDLLARAVTAGAQLVAPAERKPWGYVAAFADPDGHVWMAHTP